MIDERGPALAFADAGRRRISRRLIETVTPNSWLSRQLPFQERLLTRRAGIGVVETLAVEMIGPRAAITGTGDKQALEGDRSTCRRRGDDHLGRAAHGGIS